MSLAKYHPALDGLRAVAVMGVLCDHFAVYTPDWLPWGQIGVRFFFILSGFFATLTLWRAKEKIEESHGSVRSVVKDYYVKRLLRIGPAYYLVLFIGSFVLVIPEIRNYLLWHLFFVTNFFIVKLGYWPEAVAHFWSLSVQEQFYLIWPWVVLLLPRTWFLVVCLLLIPFAQMYCGWMIALDAAPVYRWVLLPGCIDSFAFGALAAHVVQMKGADRVFSGKRSIFAFLIALLFLTYGIFLRGEHEKSVALGFVEMFEGIFLVWLLAAVYFSEGSRISGILSIRPLVMIGKFSFGLYIYHIFVIIFYEHLKAHMGFEDFSSPWRVAVLMGVSLLCAALSYRWLEQPVLGWWKRRHSGSPTL